MWQKLYQFAKALLTLKTQTQQNTADIKALRQDLKELTNVVRHLHTELQRDRENTGHEPEKLVLKLENTLLRFERRLVSGNRDQNTED
jgi:Txe/YoeB family toxin of Txe-Axe toxin-antitoxin module